MPRMTVLFAACLGLAAPAGAQDFNAAPPNAPRQQPAFPGQTRAPVIDDRTALTRETLVSGLDQPWGMDQLPDGSWLVTERPGQMRLIAPDGTPSEPIRGLPAVDGDGQGGLLDVAIADDFASTRRVWWSYAEPREGGRTATAVATGTLAPDGTAMTDVEVVFRQHPAWASNLHYGSRLVFDGTGALFVTTGERGHAEPRALAQDVATHLGKVVRIDPDGGPAAGNPEIPGGLPGIWSYGHRNLQGATLGPDGALWTVEHGPRGGDELNRPEAGRNYGWPIISYGVEYSGQPVGPGRTAAPDIEQPLYYWDPVIAPSGMVFYQGDLFPDWRGSLLIGGLRSEALVRLVLDGTSVTGEARYFEGLDRVRDVDVAQDGAVMLLTDTADGALIRVTPAE